MADGAERQSEIIPGVYDPRRDANWQARLEEARAKREIALREKRAHAKPKKRLKPWEEEGAKVLDEDRDFSPATGLEFSDRVDAMRVRKGPRLVGADNPPALRPAPNEEPPLPGRNWVPDADLDVPLPDARAEDMDVAAEPKETPVSTARRSSVNDIFADPIFDAPSAAPDAEPAGTEDAETIPIALLRVPPPEPVRRRLPVAEDITEEEDAPADTEVSANVARAPVTSPKGGGKGSGLLAIAAVFVGAIAIGPIYKMTQPIERGPLVYTLSSFPVDPALGLTSPMFEQPAPTRSREWRPASLAPSSEPLALARPNVPERARTLANFVDVPAFGPETSSILVGTALWIMPDKTGAIMLPDVQAERPLGPEGRVAGLGRELDDLSQPRPRPDQPANG